ncbi:MAG: oligosaccharide flippase family protein, partial [Myxococcota bacterium]
VYAVSSITLAALDFGGFAIVYGNIIQSVVLLTSLVVLAGWREWLTPRALTWRRTRDVIRFGIPVGITELFDVGARTIDNLLFSYRFGTGPTALYNIAYNLADIPAVQIGENVSSVLLPSMAKIEPERRLPVLVRSTALLSLIVFPMAVGLGVVAEPLCTVLLAVEWHAAAPLLTLLAALSVFRPQSWVISSYLRVEDRNVPATATEVLKVAVLVVGILLFPSPLWACLAVGLAFAAQTVALIAVVCRINGISPWRFAPGFLGPLAACATMTAVVLGTRYGMTMAGWDHPLLALLVEMAVGAVVYVPAAFVLCPALARDLLGLLRSSFGRGR